MNMERMLFDCFHSQFCQPVWNSNRLFWGKCFYAFSQAWQEFFTKRKAGIFSRLSRGLKIISANLCLSLVKT